MATTRVRDHPGGEPRVEGDLAFVVVPDQTAEFSPPPLESFAKLDADGDKALTPRKSSRPSTRPRSVGSTSMATARRP